MKLYKISQKWHKKHAFLPFVWGFGVTWSLGDFTDSGISIACGAVSNTGVGWRYVGGDFDDDNDDEYSDRGEI